MINFGVVVARSRAQRVVSIFGRLARHHRVRRPFYLVSFRAVGSRTGDKDVVHHALAAVSIVVAPGAAPCFRTPLIVDVNVARPRCLCVSAAQIRPLTLRELRPAMLQNLDVVLARTWHIFIARDHGVSVSRFKRYSILALF